MLAPGLTKAAIGSIGGAGAAGGIGDAIRSIDGRSIVRGVKQKVKNLKNKMRNRKKNPNRKRL